MNSSSRPSWDEYFLGIALAVSKRATGSGWASRSTTLMALAVSALCTARFSVRAARDTSRDVVTVAPLRSMVA